MYVVVNSLLIARGVIARGVIARGVIRQFRQIEKTQFFMVLPYKSKSVQPCSLGGIKFYLLNMGVPTSIYRVKP